MWCLKPDLMGLLHNAISEILHLDCQPQSYAMTPYPLLSVHGSVSVADLVF